MLSTKRNEIFNGNDVINSNDLKKTIINVDTRFRASLIQPSTDCYYKFEHPYKNVIRLRVASVEIPNMWYTFSNKNYHNTYFCIAAVDISNNPVEEKIQIGDGNYTAIDLMSTIQLELDKKLKQKHGIHISVFPDPFAVKTIFLHNGVSAPGAAAPTATAKPFVLNFRVPELCTQPFNFGLGFNLGFTETVYDVTHVFDTSGGFTRYSIQSESCIDVIGDMYCLLAINDLHSVEQKTGTNYFQTLAKIIVREEKNHVIYDDGSTLLSNDVVFPSPVDLDRIQIKLMDPYGKPIDLNQMNYSFSLEITEVTNTRLYEFYRNYIWLGNIPSLPLNVTGSGQGLLGGKGP